MRDKGDWWKIFFVVNLLTGLVGLPIAFMLSCEPDLNVYVRPVSLFGGEQLLVEHNGLSTYESLGVALRNPVRGTNVTVQLTDTEPVKVPKTSLSEYQHSQTSGEVSIKASVHHLKLEDAILIKYKWDALNSSVRDASIGTIALTVGIEPHNMQVVVPKVKFGVLQEVRLSQLSQYLGRMSTLSITFNGEVNTDVSGLFSIERHYIVRRVQPEDTLKLCTMTMAVPRCIIGTQVSRTGFLYALLDSHDKSSDSAMIGMAGAATWDTRLAYVLYAAIHWGLFAYSVKVTYFESDKYVFWHPRVPAASPTKV